MGVEKPVLKDKKNEKKGKFSFDVTFFRGKVKREKKSAREKERKKNENERTPLTSARLLTFRSVSKEKREEARGRREKQQPWLGACPLCFCFLFLAQAHHTHVRER